MMPRIMPTAVTLTIALGAASPIHARPAATVELVRTQTGIAHITAADEFGLGYGQGYAQATDNLCVIARYVVTVRGESSRFFGAEGKDAANLGSDFFARYYYGDAPRRLKALPAIAVQMLRGYAAGYNQAIIDLPPGAAADCRQAPWVRPLGLDDTLMLLEARNVLGSSAGTMAALLAASPPGKMAALASREIPTPDPHDRDLGSNGWAFGRDVTSNGKGLLVGNPHFFWTGENRFYQIHLRIPGKLDVMGAGLLALPGIQIGFNRDVAWTHTISSAHRGTVFALDLVPGKPTSYRIDGKIRTMVARPVTIDVRRPDGAIEVRRHVFYETVFGPLVVIPKAGLTWTADRAFALGDALRGNVDQITTWLAMARAGTIDDLRAALVRSGTPWVNTLAADRRGDAFYGDFSRMPNVPDALRIRCMPDAATAKTAAAAHIIVLLGTRKTCNWTSRALVPDGALLAASDHPGATRSDYLVNANDSYWLANAAHPLPPAPAIVGPHAVAQGLRNRMQLIEIERRLAGADGLLGRHVDSDTARAILFRDRNYAAILLHDAIVDLCTAPGPVAPAGKPDDLATGCRVLVAWDGTERMASRGAILFRGVWQRLEGNTSIYAVPFDPRDPVNTPRGIALDKPGVRDAIRGAIGDAAAALRSAGFPIDASVAEAQGVTRQGGRVSIAGGPGNAGVLNSINSGSLSRDGYVPIHGTSYLQFVTFDDDGPIADGILAPDQATDPASPYSAVQTRAFAREQLYRLPFTDRAIAGDPGYVRRVLTIEEP
jgi:acyl-homoserine-lactone acylase